MPGQLSPLAAGGGVIRSRDIRCHQHCQQYGGVHASSQMVYRLFIFVLSLILIFYAKDLFSNFFMITKLPIYKFINGVYKLLDSIITFKTIITLNF